MKKYIKENLIWITIVLVLSVTFIANLINLYWNNDFYLITVIGKWIVEHKTIPYENPFGIEDGYKTVVQQWFYSVLCYLSYRFAGKLGVYIFILLQYAVYIAISMYLMTFKNVDKRIAFLFAYLAGFLNLSWGCRPETITNILLVLQLVCMEKYKYSQKKRYLYFILPLVFVESNLHGTMWFMHFVMLLPYMVPFCERIRFFRLIQERLQIKNDPLKLKEVIEVIPGMFLSALINPYGYRMLLLPFVSRSSIKLMDMTEMYPVTITNEHIICYLLAAILLLACFIAKRICVSTIWMSCGLLLFACLYERNYTFLSIGIVLCVSDLFCRKTMQNVWSFLEAGKQKSKCLILLFGVILCVIKTAGAISNIKPETDNVLTCSSAVTYIKEHNADYADIPIFAHFECGSFLQWNGFQRVYIETKAETSAFAVNKKTDLLLEYSQIYKTNDFHFIEEMIKKYDFQYIICPPYMNGLNIYLDLTNDYIEVFRSVGADGGENYRLYARKGSL